MQSSRDLLKVPLQQSPVGMFNSPRKYRQSPLPNQQKSSIVSRLEPVINQRIANNHQLAGHNRAQSIYDQLLTQMAKSKAERPKHTRTISSLTSKNKVELASFVTRVDERVSQTDKHATARNKQFQFPSFEKKENSALKLKPLSARAKNKRYYWDRVQEAFKYSGLQTQLVRDHFMQTYQGLNFGSHMRPANFSKGKQLKLPKASHYKDKITLVFDLDETLVHCNDSLITPHDVTITVNINGQSIKAGINVRPYAQQILQNLKEDFEIIVFTASHQCYAQRVIEYLDPQGTIVQHRLFREHCTLTNTNLYVKDLEVLVDETRPLNKIVLVDNASYSYAWQPQNGIPILPFYESRQDRELNELEEYLKKMIGCEDVRTYNQANLKLNCMVDSRGPQKAFFNIFGYQP